MAKIDAKQAETLTNAGANLDLIGDLLYGRRTDGRLAADIDRLGGLLIAHRNGEKLRPSSNAPKRTEANLADALRILFAAYRDLGESVDERFKAIGQEADPSWDVRDALADCA